MKSNKLELRWSLGTTRPIFPRTVTPTTITLTPTLPKLSLTLTGGIQTIPNRMGYPSLSVEVIEKSPLRLVIPHHEGQAR